MCYLHIEGFSTHINLNVYVSDPGFEKVENNLLLHSVLYSLMDQVVHIFPYNNDF